MRLCIIITGMGMGGAETQVAGLADGFASADNKVMIVGLTGPLIVRPVNPAVDVVMLSMSKNPIVFLKALVRLIYILEEFKPDIVHSHMVHANILARLIRLFIPIPKLFCTAHSKYEGGPARMFVYRITDRLCDCSTNVSQEAVDEFVKRGAVPSGRMKVFYNGVDTEKFRFDMHVRKEMRDELGVGDNSKVILAVGRFTEAKDYPTLITAFNRVVTSCPHTRLVIVGDGPLREDIISLVHLFGLESRVYLLGVRRDVHRLMCAADVFVLSSAWEGFGLVVAEAMAASCLIVATDCGGVAEVLGGTNVIVPPRDPVALGEGIKKQCSLCSESRSLVVSHARERVESYFALKTKVNEWIVLYTSGFASRLDMGSI